MSRRITNMGLGDVMAVSPETQIRRSIGVDGSFIRPGMSYLDNRDIRIDVTGYSSSDKGYLGMDEDGVMRLYNEYGECVEHQNGEANIDRPKAPRNASLDLKVR